MDTYGVGQNLCIVQQVRARFGPPGRRARAFREPYIPIERVLGLLISLVRL
jgi:hypothetical protein